MKEKKLLNVITYLVKNYPESDHLSNARLTKMVYLADWHHCLSEGRQITPIRWYFDNYGPFVWDVKDVVSAYTKRFQITFTRNLYGNQKTHITLVTSPRITLPPSEKSSLDHVIEQTKDLNWSDFIRLVYSTYPIASSRRYSHLDLVKKTMEYKVVR